MTLTKAENGESKIILHSFNDEIWKQYENQDSICKFD